METNDSPGNALDGFKPNRTRVEEYIEEGFNASKIDDRFETYVVYFTGNNPTSPLYARTLGRLSWTFAGQVVFNSRFAPDVKYQRQIDQTPPAGQRNGEITNQPFTYNGNVANLQYAPCPNAPAPPTNPIDGTRYFVRQHYLDFLGREPDQPGWDYWTNELNKDNNYDHIMRAFLVSPEYRSKKGKCADCINPWP